MKGILKYGVALLFLLPALVRGQYISELFEYKPAPGQHINAAPWGIPSSAATIKGGVNGSLSLGAFGGYVVFGFDQPVENHPDNPYGIDFSIFGNPLNGLSEPAIVYVMKDENQNGLPDDTWYELAGSDYSFSSSMRDYEVTYSNPGGSTAADVPWSDQLGNTGFIFTNTNHTQAYYPLADSFPSVHQNEYTLTGSYIRMPVDSSTSTFVKFPQRVFGYADNQMRGSASYNIPDNPYTEEVEHSGCDAFDIGWAVDSAGNYVELDAIHFVKVQTAVMAYGGWLGEASTEITGAVDVEPDNGISGITKCLVIKDLPVKLTESTHQLEVFAFDKGRLQPGQEIIWSVNMDEAGIDENHVLTVTESGELEIAAAMADDPTITATVTTTVDLSSAIELPFAVHHILLWPNPAKDVIRISGCENAAIKMTGISGKVFYEGFSERKEKTIRIAHLPPGVYLVGIEQDGLYTFKKFIKY